MTPMEFLGINSHSLSVFCGVRSCISHMDIMKLIFVHLLSQLTEDLAGDTIPRVLGPVLIGRFPEGY